MAQAADRRLVDLIGQSQGAQTTLPADPASAPPEARRGVRRPVSGPGTVRILSAPPGWTNLLAHAALLEVAATAWRASGRRVEVAAAGGQAETRWQTLTGIGPHRPGRPSDVLIVDHADRRSTAELLSLLAGLKPTAVAILVEGGTRPRLSWRYSHALGWLGDRRGRVDPGPAPEWGEHIGAHGAGSWPGPAPVLCLSAAEAAGVLLARWSGSATTALVGMGYPEVDGLNRAARRLLAGRGDLSGPELSCGGRVFQGRGAGGGTSALVGRPSSR
jgi:hypothetical protein